ncbi:MAG: hypothetical protein IAF38_13335, partial [Bacteroidia bacterium]|nr:hypothetical protein [Bacteroidia bacterium]
METLPYDQNKSKWNGKFRNKALRVALCIYNNDHNIVSIPISSISAYIKRENPEIELKLFHIVRINDDAKFLPPGFAAYLKSWQPDLFALSVLSTHWDGVKPYLTE